MKNVTVKTKLREYEEGGILKNNKNTYVILQGTNEKTLVDLEKGEVSCMADIEDMIENWDFVYYAPNRVKIIIEIEG